MTFKQFIKANPLLSAVIALVLCGAIYYLFSSLYAAGYIAVLNHANKELEAKNVKIEAERKELDNKYQQTQGKIQQQQEELEKKDALLKAVSEQVVNSKKNLDDATVRASRIMGNDSVLTRDELKEYLCQLYPTSNGCK